MKYLLDTGIHAPNDEDKLKKLVSNQKKLGKIWKYNNTQLYKIYYFNKFKFKLYIILSYFFYKF